MTAAAPAEAPVRRPFPLCTGIAEVLRTESLTPAMTRLVLGGEALAGFPVEEPGEIVTLLWPAPGRELVLPGMGWRFPPGVADAQHARNYTVRRFDAGAGELLVDVVLHGDHGLAARWAASARPGDTVGFAGPRVHWTTDPGAAWSLLVADETGLPAVAAIAETLAPDRPAIAVLEVADAAEEQPLAGGVDVRWVRRGGRPPGPSPLLADAVRALELPAGRGRVWGAGEALSMRGVRRHVREERGLAAADVSVLGYWKHRNTPDWD